MIIGIDLDSTLAKIDLPWLQRLNRVCGTRYSTEDWTDWNLSFLSSKEREVMFRVFAPDIYEQVTPYPGARTVVQILAKMPYVRLKCITANPSRDEAEFTTAKRKWIERYFPRLFSELIFSKEKNCLGLDVLIDDAPHHFTAPDFVPILVERPWNRHVVCRLRFAHWKQALPILKSLIAEQDQLQYEGRLNDLEQ